METDFSKIRALVSHDGNVHWEPGSIFSTTCDIDIRYFPFDEQRCPIQIGNSPPPPRTCTLFLDIIVAKLIAISS